MTESLNRLTRWLRGSFSNQQQAFENPPLYGHIQVRYRPLGQLEPRSLLIEQAYAIAPKEPYRIRVVRPVLCPERGLTVMNYTLADPQRFSGRSTTQICGRKSVKKTSAISMAATIWSLIKGTISAAAWNLDVAAASDATVERRISKVSSPCEQTVWTPSTEATTLKPMNNSGDHFPGPLSLSASMTGPMNFFRFGVD